MSSEIDLALIHTLAEAREVKLDLALDSMLSCVCPDWPWGLPCLLFDVLWEFCLRRQSSCSVKLAAHHMPVLGLRMSGAVPLPPSICFHDIAHN